MKEGIIAMCWSGMREAKGFSGWLEALSAGFSMRLYISSFCQRGLLGRLTEFDGGSRLLWRRARHRRFSNSR